MKIHDDMVKLVDRAVKEEFPEMILRHIAELAMDRLYKFKSRKAYKESILITKMALAVERELVKEFSDVSTEGNKNETKTMFKMWR